MPIQRFLRYVTYPTMSCEDSATCPSTKKQLLLADALAKDLKEIGLCDAAVDANGYVSATLAANCDKKLPVLGLIAHMDTSPDAPDDPVRPRIVLYDGADIALDAQNGLFLRESDYPCLARYRGKHLIVTDGHTLLGADDKAGVSEIIAALEALQKSNAPHGTVRICFTPDEEIGRGADLFDVKAFGADFAYTVDGGAIGELEYENFNAASCEVLIRGINIHPGDAKGRMKNACRIAMEFESLLPRDEIPEKTEQYEGFHHLCDMSGTVEKATLSYIIRDHDAEKFNAKKEAFCKAAEQLNARYGADTVALSLRDSYYNMASIIREHMDLIDRAKAAMQCVGITPVIKPIRGGTDGARLSYLGLPCPNLCTGGENFHSRFEFACVEDMEAITKMLACLIQGVAYEI